MDDELHQTLRVAMVDDEEPLCLGVRRILAKYHMRVADVQVDVDYSFTYFTNGEGLVDAIGAGQDFDLLLLDLKLPGMSGLDVLTALNERDHEILTIMITAYATFETAVQATKLGAYDFLPKPFSPEELRYAVRKATSQFVLSREARKLAEEKRQVRFNFISVLAHELKAPLNAIEGYLNIMRTDETPEHLPMIERSLLRLEGMKKLIFDLLDLTRIESGQKQRAFMDVDVAEAAARAVELLVADAKARDIAIEVKSDGPVTMTADPSEIEIILNNLVSNAVKYNRDHGSVWVRLRREGDETVIEVEDTGIGLSPAEAAKLFNEFTRIKNEDTVKILGSGLGLSTVHKLAQLYGGDATVCSEKHAGSTFTVTLREPQQPAGGGAQAGGAQAGAVAAAPPPPLART
jgi:two-component system, sensor histidine kinase and response regulator